MSLISVAALAEIFVLFEISCLAIASNWIAEGITGCLDFGRQTSAGATDTFLGPIAFFAPALC